MLANEKSKGMGDHEEGMDLADEVDMGGKVRSRAAHELCRPWLSPRLVAVRVFGCTGWFYGH